MVGGAPTALVCQGQAAITEIASLKAALAEQEQARQQAECALALAQEQLAAAEAAAAAADEGVRRQVEAEVEAEVARAEKRQAQVVQEAKEQGQAAAALQLELARVTEELAQVREECAKVKEDAGKAERAVDVARLEKKAAKMETTRLKAALQTATKEAERLRASLSDSHKKCETAALQQPIEGIGMGLEELMEKGDKGVLVRKLLRVSGLSATGAAKASGLIQVGDQVLEVQGQATAGKTLEALKGLICGPRGSVVALKIRREGQDTLVSIPRGASSVTDASEKLRLAGTVAGGEGAAGGGASPAPSPTDHAAHARPSASPPALGGRPVSGQSQSRPGSAFKAARPKT